MVGWKRTFRCVWIAGLMWIGLPTAVAVAAGCFTEAVVRQFPPERSLVDFAMNNNGQFVYLTEHEGLRELSYWDGANEFLVHSEPTTGPNLLRLKWVGLNDGGLIAAMNQSGADGPGGAGGVVYFLRSGEGLIGQAPTPGGLGIRSLADVNNSGEIESSPVSSMGFAKKFCK